MQTAVLKRWRFHGLSLLAGNEPSFWDQDGDLYQTVWIPDNAGLVLRCEIADPKSSRGRNVNVYIRGDEVEWLLKELREVAIARRSKPEGGET